MDAPALTPRALLRRVDRHVAWCRDRDEVVELDRLIEVVDHVVGGSEPPDGAASARSRAATRTPVRRAPAAARRPLRRAGGGGGRGGCRSIRRPRTSTCRRCSPPAWRPGSPSRSADRRQLQVRSAARPQARAARAADRGARRGHRERGALVLPRRSPIRTPSRSTARVKAACTLAGLDRDAPAAAAGAAAQRPVADREAYGRGVGGFDAAGGVRCGVAGGGPAGLRRASRDGGEPVPALQEWLVARRPAELAPQLFRAILGDRAGTDQTRSRPATQADPEAEAAPRWCGERDARVRARGRPTVARRVSGWGGPPTAARRSRSTWSRCAVTR